MSPMDSDRMPRMGGSTAVLHADEIFAAGTWGGVFISVFRQPCDTARMQKLRRLLEAHFARHGAANIASLTVLEPSGFAKQPPPDVRAEMTKLTQEFKS